jgi:hypothetical protein
MARFMSLNSAVAGSSSFAATDIFALLRTDSDVSADDGRSSVAFGAEFLATATCVLELLRGRLADFATGTEFLVLVAGSGTNAVAFGFAGTVPSKQICDPHRCKFAWVGAGMA